MALSRRMALLGGGDALLAGGSAAAISFLRMGSSEAYAAAAAAPRAALVGLAGRRPNIVTRFGYGPTMPMSPRRPVDAVLV